jgi:hypothetical protein
MLRDWGKWLNEMVNQYAVSAPPSLPFDIDWDAEREAGATDSRFRDTVLGIQRGLGLEGIGQAPKEDGDSDGTFKTQRWQSFLSAIPSADFDTQQMLASLRYDPERSWYQADISQLQNPKYL